MTFAPTVSIQYSTDWTLSDLTDVPGIVEYNLNVSGGSEDYINAPMPGTTSVSLTFDEDVIPPIQVGNVMKIDDTSVSGIGTIFVGKVVSRTSRYSSWGTAGFLLTWAYQLTGYISELQKISWYNPSVYTGTTNQCIDLVIANAGLSTWSTVDPALTWENIQGSPTWETWDSANIVSSMISRLGSNTASQTLDVGWRNVWDDLVTLTYGVWGVIGEFVGQSIEVSLEIGSVTNPIVANDILMVDIEGIDSTPNMRNDVTVTKYDTTSLEYKEQNSIRDYGSQPGSINTFINNNSDAATTASKIVNGLGYPSFGVNQYGINLYNPNIVATNLPYYWITTNVPVSVDAPLPMGGLQDYLTVGYRLNASKNAWIVENNVVPLSVVNSSINWEQVPAKYTWTSYGVAYPTQKWSDL